jgi:phosphoribosylanthranilate isomerase
MMVKICGITSAGDLAAAADAGASAVGFNFFAGSPRYVPPAQAQRLSALTPAGVLRVGVFVNEPAETIIEAAGRAGLDVVQLHGECGRPAGLRVWRAVAVGPEFELENLAAIEAEALLLDAPAGSLYGGTGRTFDWSRVAGLSRRIILAGGLDADNVGDAIRLVRPWGVDACSRLESAPGRKDGARVREFVQAARAAAHAAGLTGSEPE